jgi:hypothetical protein
MIMGDKRYPGLFTSLRVEGDGPRPRYAGNFKSQISDFKFAI